MLIQTLTTHSPLLSHLDHHQELICTRDSMQLFDIRSPDSRVTREVIRSRYISSAQPDMSRVTVRLDNIPRGVERTYTCTVIVEGRTDIAGGSYNFDVKGSGSSTVTVTGE